LRVEKEELGPLGAVVDGRSGVLYQLLRPTEASFRESIALVESNFDMEGGRLDEWVRIVERAIALRSRMLDGDRDLLDRLTAWPRAIVMEDGLPVGLVVSFPLGDAYLTPDRGANGPKRLMTLPWISASAAHSERSNLNFTMVDQPLLRFALAAQLSRAIEVLHRYEIVFGDLAPRHVAVSLGPPRIMLMNGEYAAALSDLNRVQLHTPFLRPPESLREGRRLQDLRTDVYKLGLCILRCIMKGRGITQFKEVSAVVRTLDSDGVLLLQRCLSDDPDERPPATEVRAYFERLTLSMAPSALLDYLGDPVPATGSFKHALSNVKDISDATSPSVFMSYRRTDQQHATYRIYENLQYELGAGSLFVDIDDIEPGADFQREIENKVVQCSVLLAVIGAGWLTASAEDGSARLWKTDDFVRMEIEAALRYGLHVIPVIIDDAPLPSAAALPESLARLPSRNAFHVRSRSFGADCRTLAAHISRIIARRAWPRHVVDVGGLSRKARDSAWGQPIPPSVLPVSPLPGVTHDFGGPDDWV
jgi:hypothetical protein